MFAEKKGKLSLAKLQRLAARKLGFPIAQTPDEVALLKKYARLTKKPNIIIEIGTRNGGSALVLAGWSMTQVVTIDILEDPRLDAETSARYGHRRVKVPLKKHWARYAGGSRIEQVTSVSWEYEFDGRPIGLVFIDGSHEYEDVKKDWMHFVPRIEPGGYVMLHDYGDFPGVTKFVDEEVAYPIIDLADTMIVFRVPEDEE